jgi:hypothetical protein
MQETQGMNLGEDNGKKDQEDKMQTDGDLDKETHTSQKMMTLLMN